ncbi:hypothetical protein BS47DRAFT_1335587 [Hydnum rufescens UP504]|uniref:Uncharacterized protein n=1 Tax=Hydnum rufescens UP504 TaxID=1448309 RepID=A0A9P6BAU1_9AGAM|nr:hypothetical protein BS47DRAFT_1335587 [Hydnum rufescens UP504]
MVHSQKITMATPSFNGEVAPPSLPTDTGIQIKQKRQAAAAIGARLGQMVPEAETSRSALGTTRPPATTISRRVCWLSGAIKQEGSSGVVDPINKRHAPKGNQQVEMLPLLAE